MTERILTAPVEEFEQELVNMLPDVRQTTSIGILPPVGQNNDYPESLKSIQPRSLAEAQLFCRFQLFNLQCQNLITSILPVIQETYTL